MELACSGCPESLAGVGGVPDVEITDLRSFGRADADDATGFASPSPTGANREGKFFGENAFGSLNGGVELFVDDERGGDGSWEVCWNLWRDGLSDS